MDKLEKYDIGIQLVSISIQDAQPPTTEVMTAFKAVETAKQGKETALNNANKYRNEQIPQAKAEADKIQRHRKRVVLTRHRDRHPDLIPCMRNISNIHQSQNKECFMKPWKIFCLI